jgi:hypothetical protein
MLEETHTPTELASSTHHNVTTKAELLSRAKTAIDKGETYARDAAEALALAVEDFKATQREIAESVGRSASWVNRLLKWRRSGYKEYSPFGPTTKAGRVSHAQQRARASKPRRTSTPPSAQANSTTSTGKSTTTEAGTSTSGDAGAATSAKAGSSTSRRPLPEEAKGNLIYAIDNWWPYLDDTGKVEVTKYFFKKTGARVS